MAWPVGPLPPSAGVDNPFILFDWGRQWTDSIREKHEFRFGKRWPAGTREHANGRVASIVVDPVDDTKLRITCEEWDEGTEAWVAVDWIGDRTIDDPVDNKWWVGYDAPEDFNYLPPFYKFCLWPPTVCSDGEDSPVLGDPNRGHSFHIDDNGETYVVVPNDGVLTLNGKVFADYVDWPFAIYRSGGINRAQAGYSWVMRHPPEPNTATLAWGDVCKVVSIEVTDPEEFTITIAGTPTAPIPFDASASVVADAIVAIGYQYSDFRIIGVAGGPFELIFRATLNDIDVTAVGATATEVEDKIADITKSWDVDEFEGKDIVFKVGAHRWHRVAIDSGTDITQLFATVGAKPNVNEHFEIIDPLPAFWRPHFFAGPGSGDLGGGIAEFPLFRTRLVQRKSWSGNELVREEFNPWIPTTWWATLEHDQTKSHHPATDNPTDYPTPKDKVFISECESELGCGDCDAYPPTGPGRDAQSFDDDLTTLAENFCTDFADLMISPYVYWSVRGKQMAIEELVGFNWVEPKDWTGIEAIPEWTIATWWKYHKVGNTRTSVITSVSGGGVATFGAVAMPQITPFAGNYTSLRAHYAVFNADGSIADSHVGLATATTLTMDAHGSLTGFVAGDVGKTVVIAWGWTRMYERLVKYLYWMGVANPELDDDLDPVWPPTEEFPGDYEYQAPSTTYAEFNIFGKLEDTAVAFITGESPRYIGDPWDAPTGRGQYLDLLYQGKKSGPDSDYPSFAMSGVGTDGGLGRIKTDALFWVSVDPLVIHEGVGTAGSTDDEVHDSALFKDWPTTVDGEIEMQERLSRFWTSAGGTRFVKADHTNGLVIEVAISGDGTELDPYVWERQPIHTQDVSDPEDPFVVPRVAFSDTTLGRPYRIREPGFTARGAMRNRMIGRPLQLILLDGTTVTVVITHNDDEWLYWSEASGVSGASGVGWKIDELEVGSVVQRKPAHAEARHNGFVRPEFATQDARGVNWYLGNFGMRRNSPTIVVNFGRHRKRDIPTATLWHEMYTGLNAMTDYWLDHDWDDLDEENYRSLGDIFTSWNTGATPAVSYADAVDNFSAGHSHFWGNVGSNGYPVIDPYVSCTANIKVVGGDTPPQANVQFAVGGHGWPATGALLGSRWASYHYGKVTLPTNCFSVVVDFYGWGARDSANNNEIDDTLPGGGFDRQKFDPMDTSLQFRKWVKWNSSGPNTDLIRVTDEALGDLNAPEMPTAGPPPDDGDLGWLYNNGFYVFKKGVIVRGNVAGGLKYVA